MSDGKFETAFDELKKYLDKYSLIKQEENKPFDFTVLKAIYQFRCYLEPKGMMTSGRHFNHHLLDEAARLYDGNYENFGNNWDSPKNLLCWQKVFGYIERFVPACDGQVIAQGPWSILENGDVSKRSLEFTYGGGSYFPLSSAPNWELGYDWAGGPRGAGVVDGPDGGSPPGFQNLCRAKMGAGQAALCRDPMVTRSLRA